jgi:hypothetical protein
MGDARAAMIFADMPYNLAVKAIVGRCKIKHREFVAASGEMSSQQFIEFSTGWMILAAQFSDQGSIHFTCIDWRHMGEMLCAGEPSITEAEIIGEAVSAPTLRSTLKTLPISLGTTTSKNRMI